MRKYPLSPIYSLPLKIINFKTQNKGDYVVCAAALITASYKKVLVGLIWTSILID
jgi:hypothetical protein